MARFQIEKGERFSLNKSEGLEKVQIDLNWKSGADLDASAFLIGEDGLIGDDADFVFYNSKKPNGLLPQKEIQLWLNYVVS